MASIIINGYAGIINIFLYKAIAVVLDVHEGAEVKIVKHPHARLRVEITSKKGWLDIFFFKKCIKKFVGF